MPPSLVWTQAPLISCSTHSSKLPFFHKAMAVVMNVYLTCINGKESSEGRMHEMNWLFEQNLPPHFLPESSVQRRWGGGGGGHIFGIIRYMTTVTNDRGKNYYTMSIPVLKNPSCLQTIVASILLQESSHTVPQTLLIQISTLPSFGIFPPTNRSWPFAQGTIIIYKKTVNLNNIVCFTKMQCGC